MTGSSHSSGRRTSALLRSAPEAAGTGNRRRKLLFLCQALPFPPDDGVQVRAYNLLRLLAAEFDVRALCFYRRSARPDRNDVLSGITGLERFADVRVFPILQDGSPIRFVWDHLRSVIMLRPYTRYVYESRAFRRCLETWLAEQDIDIVHIDSLDLAAYLPHLGDLPVICGHHNIESTLLRRRARRESSPLRRWYLDLQAHLLQREERRSCTRVDLNIVVSAVDRQLLREIAPSANVMIAANGVDTVQVKPSPDPGTDILFMGGYSWAPNREAMEHFCASILPLIRQRIPHARVSWIGRVPDSVRLTYLRKHGVHTTGYVEDIAPHLRAAACCIVPLRVGGGTRVKILDAWAAGRAVVTTPIGCEGLDAEDGINALIRDDPESFALAVCAVLESAELRSRLGRAARLTAERKYDWRQVGNVLIPAYVRLAGSRGRRSTLTHR